MTKKVLTTLAGVCLSASLSFSTATACPPVKDDGKAEAPKKTEPVKKAANASFHVDGMHCGGCADRVKTALMKADGIVGVDVSVADKRVKVNFDATKFTAEQIAKMISDLGFPASTEA